MKQRYLEERTTPAQRITIRSRAHPSSAKSGMAENGQITVIAPLPDNFGMTVGSEYSSPFEGGGATGAVSKLLSMANVGQKLAISMDRKYNNPERSEISFEMEFAAYYDAKTEVLIPVMKLLYMTLGRNLDWASGENMIKTVIQKINDASSAVAGAGLDFAEVDLEPPPPPPESVESGTNKMFELLSIIQGPPTCTIRFGDTMVLSKCFLSSSGVQFSNILDPDGIPMSAKVSVTALLQKAPVAEDISGIFDYIGNR